jgi:hypothetical protein
MDELLNVQRATVMSRTLHILCVAVMRVSNCVVECTYYCSNDGVMFDEYRFDQPIFPVMPPIGVWEIKLGNEMEMVNLKR